MDRADAARLLNVVEFPEGWEFIEVHRAGQLAGFIARKASEMHMWRRPEFKGRWITAKEIERAGAPVIAKYGHICTVVPAANGVGRAFVTRLGFHETHRDGGMIYYRTERLRHARF